MKAWLIPSILATLSGLAVSSPVEAVHAAEEPSLDKRASGTLKAWTSSGSGCSGNPGFTWTSIGDGCIHFIGGDGSAKMVQRLSWSGQACQVYGYSATGCSTNQQSTAYGTDLCFKGVTFLSFKVVC